MKPKSFKYGLVFIAIFVHWQISSVAHLIFINHEVCSHGNTHDVSRVQAVHDEHRSYHHPHNEPHSHTQHSSDNQKHDQHSDHDDCKILKTLLNANSTTQSARSDVATTAIPLEKLNFYLKQAIFYEYQLYFLSPAHSPPVATDLKPATILEQSA